MFQPKSRGGGDIDPARSSPTPTSASATAQLFSRLAQVMLERNAKTARAVVSRRDSINSSSAFLMARQLA